MTQVFVQADDFSGTAEVGCCFVEHGFTTRLLLLSGAAGTGASPAPREITDVVVADTHSRGLVESAARARVTDAFSAPDARQGRVLFKKTDSLWRGNIRAEVAALTGMGFHAVIAGALPSLQRSVRNGKPFASGIPLGQTDLWRAELAAPPADIPSLLSPEAPAAVETLETAQVRSGFLTAELTRLLGSSRPVLVVVDGETLRDLEHVVDALLELGFTAGGRRVVLVGSGETANVLAHRLADHGARNAQDEARPVSAGGRPESTARPVLAVVGSASATAQTQLKHLEQRGFTIVRLNPHDAGAAGAYGAQLASIRVSLEAGRDVAVTVAAGEVNPARTAGIVLALSRLAVQAATGPAAADLLLTGGETAREVLDALGHRMLVPLAAVQHGAVVSRAEDGTLVGTKPGSFGDDLALVQLFDLIRERRGSSADNAPPATPITSLSRDLEQK